jgi:hypothetical protein
MQRNSSRSLACRVQKQLGTKRFKTIVTLGDMIPQNILLEDEQLLMYYDIAKDRV